MILNGASNRYLVCLLIILFEVTSVCVFVCLFFEGEATVGHLDVALCHPPAVSLCFVLATGHEEGV